MPKAYPGPFDSTTLEVCNTDFKLLSGAALASDTFEIKFEMGRIVIELATTSGPYACEGADAGTPAPHPVSAEQGSLQPGGGAELNQRARCVRRMLCERGSGEPAVVGLKGGTAAAAIVFVEASKHVARAASPGARALAHGQAHARAHNPLADSCTTPVRLLLSRAPAGACNRHADQHG